MAAASLSIIIVTYNSADALAGLLDSIAGELEGFGAANVLVIDNASRDETLEVAAAHPAGPRIIETGRNAGYAAAINIGYGAISPNDHVLVLNPDMRLAPGAIKQLFVTAAETGAGIVAPRLLHPDGEVAHSIRREPSIARAISDALLGWRIAGRLGWSEIVTDESRYAKAGEVEWATGAALLITPEARRAIGTWDERFFLYSEETDYMRRARSAGFAVVFEPRASVMHVGGESGTNPTLHALQVRNRIRYYAKHNPLSRAAVFRLIVAANEGLRLSRSEAYRAGLDAALATRAGD
ncbi:Glycosyl transferase, family 2 [Devosia sp. DBB001]|nr:Glycosyl transferase, family 2 [Devosia sp. DBB001]